MKRYTPWSVLMLLLLSVTLAGCEGESPTIPTTTQPPGGPAPSGQAEVVLTASNPNPLVNSTTTITATVTIGGQPAPAGTAVEFSTNLGAFTESNSQTALRITGTNGVATVTLTSTIAGPAIVGARVANVFRTINVTFRVDTTVPPPTGTSPTITSISPTRGIPAGGELVTIVGTNFTQPLRVLFGDRVATVLASTDTQIQVATPAINLGSAEQRRAVDVRVITQAGTPEEKSATSPTQFTYELAVLTPSLTHVAPSSGPNEGNTRITIIGDGFQAPMRAFFGTGGSAGSALTDQVELEVLQVFFDRIIAMTPPALGLGTALRDQQVTLRVLNTLSNLDAVLPLAFRYGPEMQITAVEPLSGTALGGTKVTINGWGFDDPVLVTIAGVRAQPVSADGTRIVVVTSALLSPCTSVEGNILVTNVEDGAFDQYGDGTNETGFSYIGTQPSIISVAPNPALPGQAVAIGVRNAGAGTIRFQIGTSTLLPTPPAATNPQGDSIFNVTIPTNISFSTEACTDALGRAGTRFVPLVQSIVFTNITTGCTDTLNGGLTINPTDTSCRVPPDAVLNPQTVTFTGTCGGPSQLVTITVSNVGGSNLDISGIVSSLANFQVVAGTFPTTVAPGAPPASFQVQVNPLPAALPGPPIAAPPATQGTINVATNDPTPPPAIQGTVTCTLPPP